MHVNWQVIINKQTNKQTDMNFLSVPIIRKHISLHVHGNFSDTAKTTQINEKKDL